MNVIVIVMVIVIEAADMIVIVMIEAADMITHSL